MNTELLAGDCLAIMPTMEPNSVDSIVTDPPYGLGFMGKDWDHGVPGVHFWQEALRVAKPGAHLLSFGGTRTFHRLAVAIEDAGWEIRDTVMWVYGQGFPKSLDVSKAIDKHGGQPVAWFGPWFRKWREENGITQKQVSALFPSKTGGLTGCVANWELGFNLPTPEQFNLIRDTFGLPFASIHEAEREIVQERTMIQGGGYSLQIRMGDRREVEANITAPATPAAQQWAGWGTALKPAWEPIIVARKRFPGPVAANVLAWGTGAVNVDGCRIGTEENRSRPPRTPNTIYGNGKGTNHTSSESNVAGRWPANVVHDGSDEVLALFPVVKTGGPGITRANDASPVYSGPASSKDRTTIGYADTGSAARFFYTAKASKADRDEGCEGLELRDVFKNNHADNPVCQQCGGSKFDRGSGLCRCSNPDWRVNDRAARNHHPTVKPTDLMRWLVRLVTPPGGLVLDPFMGSGSTGKAAVLEGFRFVGIELEAEYLEIARRRIAAAQGPLYQVTP